MASLRDLAIRILISGEDQTGPAVRSVTAGTEQMRKGFQNLEAAAKRILGITLFVGLAKEAIELSDTYKGLQGRLKQVTDSSEELEQVNKRLLTISQTAQVPLADTVTLYSRAALALNKMADGQEMAAKLTEVVALSFKAQNSSTSEMTSTVLQLTQSLATGNVTWEDFGNVAQSNLLLANIAAKNLGYDGIASLKMAISKAQVSGAQLAKALADGFDEVKAKADAMGLTVKGAWTQMNNALLVFIGQSKEANSVSAKLAGAIHLIADNFSTVVSIAITLAEVYAARLVVGMIASTKAFFDNAAAAKVAAIAQQEARAAAVALLQTKAQEAAVNVQLKQQLLLEAAQRRALATEATAEAAAIAKLTAAHKAYEVAVTRAGAANTRLAATQETVAVSSGLLSKALEVLGAALNRLFLAWIVIDTLSKFEWWDVMTAKIAYMTEKVMLFVDFMSRPFSFASFKEYQADLDATSLRYDEIIADIGKVDAADTDSAVKIKAAEDEKAKAVEAAGLKQQQSFASVQAAVKALTATIDAETKSQSAAIQQGLTDRIAAINAADSSDTEKESLRVAAKLAAIQQTLTLDQNAATQKLALIDQEYAAELANAQANAERLAAVETSKREAKLSVYRGIAEFYAGEIAKLSTLYGEETAAFAQSREDLQALARTHDQALRAIEQEGKTEHEKLAQDQSDFDAAMNEIRKERKKGEGADQQKINELTVEAKSLSADLTKTNVEGGLSQYKAKENLNKLYDVEKQALIENGVEHGKNALAVKSALDTATAALTNVNTQINTMTEALNKDYLLKIGVDQASVSAAQATIAELTKPETKVITIVTQAAQSGGGLAGYASGGPARRSGVLPGFGGGDKIHALLEAGEFIVRKEAVRALGVPVLNLVNAGQVPIKRAGGGLVNEDALLKKMAERKGEDDAFMIGSMLNNVTLYGFINNGSGDKTTTTQNMLRQLHNWGRDDLGQYIEAGMTDDAIKSAASFSATRDIILEKIKASGAAAMTPVAALAKAQALPSVDLQKFINKAAGSAASQAPSAQLLQTAKKTVNVNFQAPGAEAVSGQFNETDMQKLLNALQSAGLRTSLGA